jgi:hypothetical protein
MKTANLKPFLAYANVFCIYLVRVARVEQSKPMRDAILANKLAIVVQSYGNQSHLT